MAQISLLNTRTASFGDLISNGKIYRVPPFQRDYSWNEEHWEDLWQDVLALHTSRNSIHYMGAIVLQSSSTSDKEFTIIDGQQRLATLSIIAIAVIEKIQKLADREVQAEEKRANQERQEILKRTYLCDKDPRSLRYSSKIILNESNNDFYQSNLINLRTPLNVRSLSKSNQLLWRAFQEQAFELLDRLENYSSLFIALDNSNDDFWRDTPENRQYIREMQLFGVKQAYPTLFTAYEKFSAEDFTRLLKLVCVISFRYTVVSSLNPNELEMPYDRVAIGIANGEITSPRQVFDNLRSVYVSDEKFLQDFALLSISTRGQRKKLARYILGKLETEVSGKEVNEDSFSIEHILPESPSSEWMQNFTDMQIEEMVYRIGNLTPLEHHLNRQVSNGSYTLKREVYRHSVYQLTRDILAEEWTPDTLAVRQRQLAKRAIHIWRSDFAS